MIEWKEDIGAELKQMKRNEGKEGKGEDQKEIRKPTEKDQDCRQAMTTQNRNKLMKKTVRKMDTVETHRDTDKARIQQQGEEKRDGEQQMQEWEGEDGRLSEHIGNRKEDKQKTPQQSSGGKEPPPLLQQEEHKPQHVKTEKDGQKQGKRKQTIEVENPDRQMKYRHKTSWHRRPGLKLLLIQVISWRTVKDAVLLLVLLCAVPLSATTVSVNLHVGRRGLTRQGEDFSLVCVVSPPLAAHTSPDFSWYRDGTLLQNQTGHELSFSPLSKSDEGDYQCQLMSEDATRVLSSSLSLRVTVFENISLVAEVEVEEGQNVALNCSVHSDPTAFLTWIVGDKVVRTAWSNSDSLVLHNAWLYHRVVVKCQAYNSKLLLRFLDAYSLIRRKGTYEVVSTPHIFWKGDTVLHRPFVLECIVSELPNHGVNVHLTYTWYKDHKVMEGQSDMILVFPSLRKEDRGLYTCTARNGEPRTTSLESTARDLIVFFSPEVHIEPRSSDKVIIQAAGETLTLTCKVTQAFPPVDHDGYRWSYLPSPGGQLRPLEGRESILILGPLTREDSGQYICQAWNDALFLGLIPPGNASVTVDVVYLENITLTSDLEVNEGDSVTLTCLVDSKPAARLSWLVEGREIHHVTYNVDHYVVERAACSDTKTYMCRASNPRLPGLEISRSSHVLVKCTEKGPQVESSSPSLALTVGLPVSIVIGIVFIVVVVFVRRTARHRERPSSLEQYANCRTGVAV